MAWIAVGVTAASVAVSLYSGQKQKQAVEEQGRMRQQAANLEAGVLESNATQAVAAAQRNMIDAQRVSKLMESRAQALSAASGGGATSPTALKVVSDIAREGSYNAAKALYQGEEAARLMRLQAYEKRQTGEFDLQEGNLQGKAVELSSFGTALGTAGGLYGKYGGRERGTTPGGPGSGAINWDLNGEDV